MTARLWRLDRFYTSTCRLDRLDARTVEGERFPDWRADVESQRDHTAESMGY